MRIVAIADRRRGMPADRHYFDGRSDRAPGHGAESQRGGLPGEAESPMARLTSRRYDEVKGSVSVSRTRRSAPTSETAMAKPSPLVWVILLLSVQLVSCFGPPVLQPRETLKGH